MIPVCFHQRRSLLTARWRASTCWMGCLFSSSVLCLYIDFSSVLPPPSSAPFMMIPFSPCASTFDLRLLFISPCLFFLSYLSPSSPFVSVSLPSLSGLRVSAPCPAVEESRLGPSSVSGKVALQLAACHTRGLSLRGRATHTSAPLLPRLRRNGPAGSHLPDPH